MSQTIDPRLIEIFAQYDEDVETGTWNCHGTRIALHPVIERIAVKAGITFLPPTVIEANLAGRIAVVLVEGMMGDRREWSFGEASPINSKNSYPYAMAEKRAKDRVALKLVGLSGLAYSEEEADDWKYGDPTDPSNAIVTAPRVEPERRPSGKPVIGRREDGMRTANSLNKSGVWNAEFMRELNEVDSVVMLNRFTLDWSVKINKDDWPEDHRELAREEIRKHRNFLLNRAAADDDNFPGDRP
jgi:hypothetical protein